MHPSLHLLLVEQDQRRGQALAGMLASLGMVSTHVADTARASSLLTQIRPDGLLIGVHSTTTRPLRSWLAELLDATPLWTLLYAEHGALLDVASLGLPAPVSTLLWPCSHSDLALLLSLAPHLSGGSTESA